MSFEGTSGYEAVRRELIETYNKALADPPPNFLQTLATVIDKAKGYSIPELSLCYAIQSDLLFEQTQFEKAYNSLYQAYAMDPKRKEVLHSLINLHLPRTLPDPLTNPYADITLTQKYITLLTKCHPNDLSALVFCGTLLEELQFFDKSLGVLLAAHKLALTQYSSDELYEFETKITKVFLRRYQSFDDGQNMPIIRALVEVIQFKKHKLDSDQKKSALEEIAERAELYLSDAANNERWNDFNICLNLVSDVIALSESMIEDMCAYYEAMGLANDGIDFLTKLLSIDADVQQTELSVLLYQRGTLYESIGDNFNANRDFNSCDTLAKTPSPNKPTMRITDRINASISSSSPTTHYTHMTEDEKDISASDDDDEGVDMDISVMESITSPHINDASVSPATRVRSISLKGGRSTNAKKTDKSEIDNDDNNATVTAIDGESSDDNPKNKSVSCDTISTESDSVSCDNGSDADDRNEIYQIIAQNRNLSVLYQTLKHDLRDRNDCISEIKLESHNRMETIQSLHSQIAVLHETIIEYQKKEKQWQLSASMSSPSPFPINGIDSHKESGRNSSIIKSVLKTVEFVLGLSVLLYCCAMLQGYILQ